MVRNYWNRGTHVVRDWPTSNATGRIDMEQYEALVANDLAQNPEFTYKREGNVILDDASGGYLTCHFSANWETTKIELTTLNGGTRTTEPFSDFSSLPEQQLTVIVD